MEPHRGTHTDGSDVPEGNGKGETGEKTVPYSLFECQECSAVALGVRDGGDGLACHGEPMEEVGAQTDLDAVMENASPSVAVEIYDYAFRRGTVSVTGTAEQLGYDPETVSEHIQSLVEAGLLDERTPELGGGSSVTVYEPRRIG
jgi:DNA-binding transcriptional ArsR family regulator